MTATVLSVNRIRSAASSSVKASSLPITTSKALSATSKRSRSLGRTPPIAAMSLPSNRWSCGLTPGRPPILRKATRMFKTQMLLPAALTAVLAITGTAAAQWTPTKPGDPRICPGHTATECATAAATFAFKAKYVRVTGHAFANTLKCSTSGSVLSYVCAWGTPANQTPVRFAHKAAGWKVAVGLIP